MRPMTHTYEADNLVGLRIDDGRLEFIAVLGQGAEGDVLLGRNVAPPGLSGIYREELYAVKVVSKIGLAGRAFLNLQDEITLHHKACADGYPGILTLHNVVDLPNTLYLISSFAPSGDLFERIVNPLRPRLCTQPETVRSIIVQLIDAVDYLHNEKGIAHRDIKPENLFWAEDLSYCAGEVDAYDGIETGRLLIGDFGLATEDRFAADFGSGTSFYTSPEAAGYFRRIGSNGGAGASAIGGALLSPIHLMTDSKSGLAIPSPAEPGKSFQWENRLSYDTFISDIWSIGIVLINLICERNPWQCALHVDDTFRAYVEDPHNTLIAVLPSLSDESHELLKKVLKVNPRDRITLQEFKEEMLKIKEFVKLGAEQDIIIEDSALRHDSWLDVGPRESTPGSASAASQGPSIGSTSGWLTTDASSTRSHLSKSNTPLSSYDSTSDSKSQLSSAQNVPAEINSGINATKPKRPLPIPLQIDPYRLSAALPGHVSASLASARYAAYARPGSAIPFPIQIPNTAPVIRLTSAQSHVQSTRKEHGGETINNVVKLRMPPSPAVMRERQAQQKEEKQARINSSDFMRVDEEGDMAVNLSFPPLHSPAVDSLAASVPCQLSLSGSTDESSESGVVTPVDQTGPYVALKGEKEDAEREEKAGVYKDREHLREANDRPEMGDDQWLTIKPGQEAMHQRYLSSQLSSDLPPITPTEGQFSLKSLEAPPLTPLLLTPTSGRRYHPYGGNPYSGQAALINSPLRMAQQAFLESHYRQYGGRDGYLGAGNTLAAHHAYAGGPRRGSVPEARTMGANGSRVNGGGGADLMSRFAGREKKK